MNSYSFTVGQIACTVLLDGASLLGVERVLRRFRDATEADYRRAYADIGLSLDTADTSFNILVARVGDQTVLIDTGEAGRPNGGLLAQSMHEAGIAPDAITLVVITHADGDHVLGTVRDDGTSAFPNASFVISKPEMDHWQHRIDAGSVDHGAALAVMQQQGLRLIEPDEQIIPGVAAVPLIGHTPGQIGVLLASDGAVLIVLSDLLHTPMQFAHPEWSSSFDLDSTRSVPTRRAALGRAADEGMLALFYHLTFPGLGYVERARAGFRFRPLVVPGVGETAP